MSDLRILCLDQAEKCGFSIYEGNKLIKHGVKNFENPNDSYAVKIHNIKQWMIETIKKEKIAIVVLEDTFLKTGFGGKPVGIDKYASLNKLLGVLENYCIEQNLLYWIVKPTEWRKVCGIKTKDGRKSLKREEIKANTIAYIKESLNINVLEDEADAICIGKYFVDVVLPKVRCE